MSPLLHDGASDNAASTRLTYSQHMVVASAGYINTSAAAVGSANMTPTPVALLVALFA